MIVVEITIYLPNFFSLLMVSVLSLQLKCKIVAIVSLLHLLYFVVVLCITHDRNREKVKGRGTEGIGHEQESNELKKEQCKST